MKNTVDNYKWGVIGLAWENVYGLSFFYFLK